MTTTNLGQLGHTVTADEPDPTSTTFYNVVANSLGAFLANTFVWFAVTFWVYLQTQSVTATSVMAGIYLGTTAISGFFLGSLVDRYAKRAVMLSSSFVSLALFAGAWGLYATTPAAVFTDASSARLWGLILLTLGGALAGNVRGIALSTLVTLLVPADRRDKANGVVGTANGAAFLMASIFSGLAIAFIGLGNVLLLAVALTVVVLVHLWSLRLPAGRQAHEHAEPQRLDLAGTIRAIGAVPGLFALIFFNTFNNFLGGVFMSLMDAYGLQLVSVQVWGILWGFLSLGFVVGGLVVARRGLGRSPLRTLFLVNTVMWTICIFFTAKASIVLLAAGMFVYLCLIPVVEAAEQTILQTMIPPERQGRVFGFAQSIEQAASPLTALMIGPLAELVFIPFMTTGAGAGMFGSWLGTGSVGGIALVFTLAGVVGLTMTRVAVRSRAYRRLAAHTTTASA